MAAPSFEENTMVRVCSLALALSLIAFATPGCAVSRENAREQAVGHVCDRYQACGSIGSGETYSSRGDCEVKQGALWTDIWPASSCDNQINSDELAYCLESIDHTDCSSILDFWTTLSKCSKDQVCKGN